LFCNARRPDLAALPGGGFVAVWNADEIAARLFDADRRPVGPDFQVNLTTEGAQDGVRVAALPGGGFVVAWADAFLQRIAARLFDASGSPLGGEIDLATFPFSFLPNLALAGTPDGSFWAVWETGEGGLDGGRFTASGNPLATIHIDGSASFNLQQQPAIAVNGEGDLVLVWAEVAGGLADPPFPGSLLGQRFGPSGQPLGERFRVAPEEPFFGLQVFGPAVAATPAGGFVAAWIGSFGGKIYVRRFDAEGEPLAPPQEIGEAGIPRREPASSGIDVTVLADGRFVVTWDSLSFNQPLPPPEVEVPGEIFLRIFTAAGTAAAPPMRVNLTPGAAQRAPSAAVLASGDVAVAWWTELPVPPILPPDCFLSDGVFARVLSVDCLPGAGDLCLGEGERFRVHVTWQDPFNGGSGFGRPFPLTEDTGGFWFFDPDNLELTVKVIDGRRVNEHFWFFYGALTNVEYQITVTDRETGATRVYENPPRVFGSFGDTRAFHEPPPPAQLHDH
jgi:hypothetical protein